MITIKEAVIVEGKYDKIKRLVPIEKPQGQKALPLRLGIAVYAWHSRRDSNARPSA